MPATVRLAEAPIRVLLSHRHAPSERHHHSGSMLAAPPNDGAIFLMRGIIVATNGMLSTIEDRTADAQRMAYPVVSRSPPVAETSLSASIRNRPLWSTP